jgi:hypothetical protein
MLRIKASINTYHNFLNPDPGCPQTSRVGKLARQAPIRITPHRTSHDVCLIDKLLEMSMLCADAEETASPSDRPHTQEIVMKSLRLSLIAMGALLMAAPAFAQTPATKQQTQDGNSPTTVGPASGAYKQKTQDGNSPTMVGPGSKAYKQQTQGELPMVGPGSKAYKQN